LATSKRCSAIRSKRARRATIDPATGGLRVAANVRRLGKLVLSEAPLEKLVRRRAEAGVARCRARSKALVHLDWDDAARQTRGRVAFMRTLEAEAWPDWSDEALLETLRRLVGAGAGSASRLKSVDVSQALLNTLDYELRRRLDAEAPAKFETPAGSSLSDRL
jgi:ATP-dependent helicase HrpB